MKKFYLSGLLGLACLSASSQSPTLDGVINATEGYVLVSTADGTAGWAGANAKKLYYAEDTAYYYFAAEISADTWMSYGLILNTLPSSGGSADGWGRQIHYLHTEKPDFEVRGNISGGYAEFHSWAGTAWAGLGVNVGTETAASTSAVEIRIAKAILGIWNSMDAQFYITGDQNDHGSFDAVPNDNNAQGWNPPSSVTNLSQYITIFTTLNENAVQLSGKINHNRVDIQWNYKYEDAAVFVVERSYNAQQWETIGSVNFEKGKSYYQYNLVQTNARSYYRIKMINKDQKMLYSKIITLEKQIQKNIRLLENPSRNMVKIGLDMMESTPVNIELLTLDGKLMMSKNFKHIGGYGVLQIPVRDFKGTCLVVVKTPTTVETFKVLLQ